MNDHPRDAKPIAPSLEDALRRARIEAAEQAGASSTSREVDLARLDMLEDAVRPVIEQAPREANLFDFGKSYGDQPRLFLDMIAFIELAEDHRTYRFFQDTRYGRILIAESARIETIVAAVTNYVARRLIERERALASDWRSAASAPQEPAITRSARTLPLEPVRSAKTSQCLGRKAGETARRHHQRVLCRRRNARACRAGAGRRLLRLDSVGASVLVCAFWRRALRGAKPTAPAEAR